MPADSPCIGVDLAPIKPVTKCIALQEDITSQRCRVAIRRHLLDAKVDVVLHDGAPNVGTSWLQDAYGQNELTIFALRLAVDFLQPGGCFVTKAFRSQDYNSLLFVFKQLFAHVEATKPQASRNESAEIFVVCRGFKNAQIDPRFLDPKTVFKDLDVPTPSNFTGAAPRTNSTMGRSTSAHRAPHRRVRPRRGAGEVARRGALLHLGRRARVRAVARSRSDYGRSA